MISIQQGSPGRRNSASTSRSILLTSLNTRIVPFISHYYSLLGDSPLSLTELHKNDSASYLKWQIPGSIFGTIPRIQGSTLLDNGLVSIKSYGFESFSDVFSRIPAINCRIPVEILDVNSVTDLAIVVTVHGSVVYNTERYLFFQVLQIYENRDSFLIGGNIFHIFPVPFDPHFSRSLTSLTTANYNKYDGKDPNLWHQTQMNDAVNSDPFINDLSGATCSGVHAPENGNHQVQTFPTYQDHKDNAVREKPQIKIHGLPLTPGLTDKDILSAISFQLNNFNEGFAIAINRTKEKAVVQVDSFQSQDHLSQRGVYIKGIKYKVTVLNKKGSGNEAKNSTKNKDHNNSNKKGQNRFNNSKKNDNLNKRNNDNVSNNTKEPDSEGWITVRNKSKSR